MTAQTKRTRAWEGEIAPDRSYGIDEAIALVKKFASAKFRESVDVAVNLGIDASKSDQVVRGSALLPHGTGKVVRVAVFAQGQNADKAKAAGADVVGFEDLAEKMKAGELNYDTVIATPDAMRIVGQLGRVLGPRGLMPNPKVGTVTQDVETAVRNAKAGQVRYRADKAGIVHASIGKADFEVAALRENLLALLNDLKKVKPPAAKGIYLKRMTLSSTMGPGVQVDQSSLDI
jgi:large subunit ribosomal protein L1